MEKIPETFKKYGYDFELLKREGDIVLYSQSAKAPGGNKRTYGYEVHKVRVSKERLFGDTVLPECERLAGATEFGYYGWSFQKRENAEIKFKEMIENEEK